MLFREMIAVREWKPFVGGRYIYQNGRVVDIEKVPDIIDWGRIPIPPLPEKKEDEVCDYSIKVWYFDINKNLTNDDLVEATPLASFQIWDKEIEK